MRRRDGARQTGPGRRRATKGGARARAARIVHAVANGRSLDDRIHGAADDADHALVSALAFGTIRHWFSLSEVITHSLEKPLRKKDAIVFCLLAVGAFQIRHLRIPAHAAVDETVAAATGIGRPWAKALINQILRGLSDRNATNWPPPISTAAKYDHPDWITERVFAQRGEAANAILAANLTRAPMTLRVNRRKGSRPDYLELLRAAGMSCAEGECDTAVYLDEPVAVADLPGFVAGNVSVQDEGAQWATTALSLSPGDRVLDACAAPGGKALACLERADVHVTALDIDATRGARISLDAVRLGLTSHLEVLTADATTLDWWDGRLFDKVLIDAPCSGTGTLRRHPDIKLLKHAADLQPYRTIQSKLSHTLAAVLKPGGSLIYCTCSILDEENDAVISDLLHARPELRLADVPGDFGMPARYGRLILPTEGGSDGFYYAHLVRR